MADEARKQWTVEEVLAVAESETEGGRTMVRVTAVRDGVIDDGVRHDNGETFAMEASLVPPHIEAGQVRLVMAQKPAAKAGGKGGDS